MVQPLKDGRLRARLRLAVHESLLEAAERAIVEEGVEGASLLSIAKRAGVAVGTIYNYFSDRQELFRELFTNRKADLLSALDVGMKSAAGEPFVVQLERFAHILLTHYDARREFMRVVLASEPLRLQMMCDKAGRMRSIANDMQNRAERVMRVGAQEKRIRENEVGLLATVFTSILRGVLLARIDDKGALAESAPRAVELFCNGAFQ
jgi:AcrR family transcriptional regulator